MALPTPLYYTVQTTGSGLEAPDCLNKTPVYSGNQALRNALPCFHHNNLSNQGVSAMGSLVPWQCSNLEPPSPVFTASQYAADRQCRVPLPYLPPVASSCSSTTIAAEVPEGGPHSSRAAYQQSPSLHPSSEAMAAACSGPAAFATFAGGTQPSQYYSSATAQDMQDGCSTLSLHHQLYHQLQPWYHQLPTLANPGAAAYGCPPPTPQYQLLHTACGKAPTPALPSGPYYAPLPPQFDYASSQMGSAAGSPPSFSSTMLASAAGTGSGSNFQAAQMYALPGVPFGALQGQGATHLGLPQAWPYAAGAGMGTHEGCGPLWRLLDSGAGVLGAGAAATAAMPPSAAVLPAAVTVTATASAAVAAAAGAALPRGSASGSPAPNAVDAPANASVAAAAAAAAAGFAPPGQRTRIKAEPAATTATPKVSGRPRKRANNGAAASLSADHGTPSDVMAVGSPTLAAAAIAAAAAAAADAAMQRGTSPAAAAAPAGSAAGDRSGGTPGLAVLERRFKARRGRMPKAMAALGPLVQVAKGAAQGTLKLDEFNLGQLAAVVEEKLAEAEACEQVLYRERNRTAQQRFRERQRLTIEELRGVADGQQRTIEALQRELEGCRQANKDLEGQLLALHATEAIAEGSCQ